MSLTSEAQAIILSGTLKAHSSEGMVKLCKMLMTIANVSFFNIHALSSYHDENGDDQHDHNDD